MAPWLTKLLSPAVPGITKLISTYSCLALLFCLAGINTVVHGQCTFTTRKYASVQQVNAGLLTSVSNPGNAVDGVPADYSTLNRPLGVGSLITVTQYLKFGSTIFAGTPVTVKANFPAALVSLLAGVEIQPFTNLHNDVSTLGAWQADAAGVSTSNSALLGLINGAGDMEITITPKNLGGTAVAYDGVWVRLSGVAIGQSLNLFHAYIMQNASAAGCGTAVDVLAGVRAGGVALASATGSVTSPFNAIDNDVSTYAALNTGAQVLSNVFLTTIFGSPSQPGDVVQLILQNPGGGLLNLGLLSNFTIQLYNGSTPVGLPAGSSSGTLSLTLLPGTAGNEKYQLDISSLTTNAAFDRVDVQIGGVAAVGTSLNIYDVKRIPAIPATSIAGVPGTSQSLCLGNTAALAVSNTQLCTTYTWYDAPTGGNIVATGASFTPAVADLGSTGKTYYIQATRTGCTETGNRTPVTLNIVPLPTFSNTNSLVVCKGATAASIPYVTTNAPITYSIIWDPPAITAGFVNVTNLVLPAGSISVTVPAGAPPATYTGTITVKNSYGCLSNGKAFSISVDTKPTQPVINVTL